MAGPNDDNTQPNPAAGVLGAGAPPDASQLPVRSLPAVQAPAPQVQNPMERHSILGRGLLHVAHALEGNQVNYEPDGQGGTREVVSPRKPGGLFRDMILGAIAGSPAGAARKDEYASPAVGLARGSQAGMNVVQQGQERRKGQALEQSAQQQKDQQHQIEAASIAQHTLSSLTLGHNLPFHTDKEVDQFNNAQENLKQAALENGGQLAQVKGPEGKDLNGKTGNGPAFMAMFNNNAQSVMQGPDGYHRVPIITHDTSGLVHKNGQWVDSKTGQPPTEDDWNKNATVYLVDVPSGSWSKQMTQQGSTINSVAGTQFVKDPNKSYVTSFGSLFSLGLKGLDQLKSANEERTRGPKDSNEAFAWKSAADTANPNDPDYQQTVARGKKGAAFVNAQTAQKEAEKGGKAPTNLDQAASALTAARIADTKNSTTDTKQSVRDAQQFYDSMLGAEKDKLKSTYAQQLQLAAGKAQAEREAKEQYDRNLYGLLSSGDPTGWKPKTNQFMTESQFNTAKDKFGATTLDKAQAVERSYQMFNDAYAERKTAKTGAPGMLALSTHLATTFGNVKGSRVTKDMIQEHLGARSISDKALVAVQRLTNGDPLSPDQWDAFRTLIADSRNKTWSSAADQAHYRGLPADFLPSDLTGQTPAPAPTAPTSSKPTQPNMPPLQKGYIRFTDSQGGTHDIPAGNLRVAKQRDPNLTVVQQ